MEKWDKQQEQNKLMLRKNIKVAQKEKAHPHRNPNCLSLQDKQFFYELPVSLIRRAAHRRKICLK